MQTESYPIKEFRQCPFCGRIWMTLDSFPGNRFAVRCLCGANGPREESREKAIRAWNIRDRHLLWNPFRLSIRFPNDALSVDFRGNLDSIDLATVLQMLTSKEKTGILHLARAHMKSAICLKNGNIIAASDSNGLRLGQILMNKGLVSSKNLREALRLARKSEKMLGETLLSMNLIDSTVLREVICHQVQEAVLELFFWRDGSFEYRDCIIDFDQQNIREINTIEIIMESARRLDEWNELRKNPPDTDS
ncbi:MAG: DUF4388 domain-containing protein [Desulfobacterales bacterium]